MGKFATGICLFINWENRLRVLGTGIRESNSICGLRFLNMSKLGILYFPHRDWDFLLF